jgi:hypothetical protein
MFDSSQGNQTSQPPFSGRPIHPVDESHSDLWRDAYTKLREEKPSLVKDYEDILFKNMGKAKPSAFGAEKSMSRIVTQKLEEMKSKEWELRWRGKSVKVREQVDRIVKVVKVFKDLGSTAAPLDPIHAGLPWAGVCVLLSVSKDISCLVCIPLQFRARLEVVMLTSEEGFSHINPDLVSTNIKFSCPSQSLLLYRRSC